MLRRGTVPRPIRLYDRYALLDKTNNIAVGIGEMCKPAGVGNLRPGDDNAASELSHPRQAVLDIVYVYMGARRVSRPNVIGTLDAGSCTTVRMFVIQVVSASSASASARPGAVKIARMSDASSARMHWRST